MPNASAVQPISGVTTATSPGPVDAFDVSGMTLVNVVIAGQAIDATITDRR
ncbi:hypothetical protein [Burkholderia sp. F1]|uniref:hypothetical protein n=1 Tax=Burkholderia sp. F1 TaxID=3366817 RepID=UPI003D75D994